jgi:hypothetical protein
MAKTPGAKSTPGLTEEEQAAFIATWIDPFKPQDFEGALHKLMAIRVVRALATPNSERLAQLLDKMLRAKWKVKVMSQERKEQATFTKPGAEQAKEIA